MNLTGIEDKKVRLERFKDLIIKDVNPRNGCWVSTKESRKNMEKSLGMTSFTINNYIFSLREEGFLSSTVHGRGCYLISK